MIDFGIALLIDCLAYLPRDFGKLFYMLQVDWGSIPIHKEEPIATPCNVAANDSDAFDIDCHLGLRTIARHIANANLIRSE